jgi:hypothetical protein
MGSSSAAFTPSPAPSARPRRAASSSDKSLELSSIPAGPLTSGTASSGRKPSGGSPAGSIAAMAARPSRSAIDSRIARRTLNSARASDTSVFAMALGPPPAFAAPRSRETA